MSGALESATVAALKTHRARQTEEMISIGKSRLEDGYVFTANPQGEPYHPQRLIQMLKAKAKAAGLTAVKLRALWHGHATHMLENGVLLKVASERLGHSSISITGDIDSHVSAAVDKAAATQVAAAIDGI